MIAITTTYKGPTNHKGARLVATDGRNKATVSYSYELSADQNHAAAAKALCLKMEWPWKMIGGHTEASMVWVFDNPTSPTIGGV